MQKLKFARLLVVVALALIVVYGVYWGSAQATFGLIAWDSGLLIQLPAYNSTVGASDTMFFSQYQWNDANASKVTFNNVRMGTGGSIGTLGVSSNVNITFSSLANDKLSYLVDDAGSQNFTGVTEPNSVKIDGALVTSGWSFSGNTLKVDGAATSVEILFDQGLTSEDAVGIAIAFGVVAIVVAVVFGVIRRNKNDD